jgi:hypothetical protein
LPVEQQRHPCKIARQAERRCDRAKIDKRRLLQPAGISHRQRHAIPLVRIDFADNWNLKAAGADAWNRVDERMRMIVVVENDLPFQGGGGHIPVLRVASRSAEADRVARAIGRPAKRLRNRRRRQ